MRRAIHFPTIIGKKVEFDKKIPKHWNIKSLRHVENIKNAIEAEFKMFKSYYNDDNLNEILKEIKTKNKDLVLFMNNIPFLSKFYKNDTIINTIYDGNILKELYILFFTIY